MLAPCSSDLKQLLINFEGILRANVVSTLTFAAKKLGETKFLKAGFKASETLIGS